MGEGGDAGGSGAGGPLCDTTDPADSDESARVGQVDGMIVDLDGAPVVDIPVKVCGVDRCPKSAQGRTMADGSFSLDAVDTELLVPRLTYGEGKAVTAMLAPLPTVPDASFGVIHSVRLPGIGEGSEIVGGMPVASGGAVLLTADGGSIDFDSLAFPLGERDFRAALFAPEAGSMPAIDLDFGFELMIATSPIDTLLCPAASLSFPNEASWPAGAAVEIFQHGHRSYKTYAQYAGWTKVSDAIVSDDGGTITTAPGSGIHMLGLFGARLRP